MPSDLDEDILREFLQCEEAESDENLTSQTKITSDMALKQFQEFQKWYDQSCSDPQVGDILWISEYIRLIASTARQEKFRAPQEYFRRMDF